MSTQSDSLKALRDMNDDELVEHLRLTRRKLFEIRFQQATGQVENHRQIRDLRHEIARTMTVQIESQHVVSAPEARGPVSAPDSSPRSKVARVPSVARHPSPPAPSAEDAVEPGAPAAKRVRRTRAAALPVDDSAKAGGSRASQDPSPDSPVVENGDE